MIIYTEVLTKDEIAEARKKWGAQRGQAIYKRKIEWELTFDDWMTWWINTGHWHDRGRGAGKYCMSRIGDKGGYELTNIFCQPFVQNISDGTKGKSHCKKGAKWSDEAKARRRGAGNPMYGKKHSEETKRKQALEWTDERRKEQSKKSSMPKVGPSPLKGRVSPLKGRVSPLKGRDDMRGENHHAHGKKQSAEHIAKRIASYKATVQTKKDNLRKK